MRTTFLLVQHHSLLFMKNLNVKDTHNLKSKMKKESTTYQGEAEEVFRATISELAWATNDLTFELTLEDLGNESDLLVAEGDAAQVPKRGLGQVVK